MKKMNLNIILFSLTLISLSILNIVKSNNGEVTELENRTLQPKPSFSFNNVFRGNYFKEYEDYFSDHFAFRDNLVKISSSFKELKGLANKEGIDIVAHNGANLAQPEINYVSAGVEGGNNTEGNKDVKAGDKKSEPEQKTLISKEGIVLGSMLIVNDKAMEIYNFDKESSMNYAKVINNLQEKLDNRCKVYSLLVPTQIEFLDRNKYKNVSASQLDAIKYINSNFNGNVLSVNSYDTLKENREKYLYFRTDHHWTALGAYYGYAAFINMAGEKPVPLERYDTGKVEGFLGSTYSATLNKKLQANPDTIYYYKPFVKHEYNVYYQGALKMNVIDLDHADKKNKYRIFISGDRPLGKIVTEADSTKKILVIKDSYANAFIPFLIPHYKEIYIADPRQFEKNVINFIKENEIQEVLVLNYVPAANDREFTKLIENITNN